MTINVLFVCLGNICRSPTAEAVFRALSGERGYEIDSAGTAGWHVGKRPDPRAISEAAARGYDLTPLRARQVTIHDFNAFDYVLAMDADNLNALQQIQPANSRALVRLFMDYAPEHPLREVPDPYYDNGFPRVLDMIEAASSGFLRATRE